MNMKKLTLALAFIIVLSSISMLMTSCGGKNKQIIGTWECISDESLDVKTITFTRNGEMIGIDSNGFENREKYKIIDDDEIQLGSDSYKRTYNYKIEGDKLTLYFFNEAIQYQKK